MWKKKTKEEEEEEEISQGVGLSTPCLIYFVFINEGTRHVTYNPPRLLGRLPPTLVFDLILGGHSIL